MDIKVKINPLHNANYYLDVNFDDTNVESANMYMVRMYRSFVRLQRC